MNIAYFRTSTFDLDATVHNVRNEAGKLGLNVLGSTQLPGGSGTVLHICNPTWLGNLIASDKTLIGLLPCSVIVSSRNGEVTVGAGSPSVLGSVSRNPAVTQLAAQADQTLKDLIHKAAGVGPRKPVNVKLYSTMTCPYCKMEASWLDEKKVKYEQVHVDLNQKEAENMVAKTGQMGVPVTEINYEDGEAEYIIGFDRSRLTQILNVTQ